MVQSALSSKSNRSQAKSTHNVGPPTGKRPKVSMAKAKKIKQESIKKYDCTGEIFFLLSSCVSDIDLDQMKMQNMPRKIQRQKLCMLNMLQR